MASHIERRKFLATLGGAAATWPLVARAQQPKVPTIGALVIGNISPEEFWREFRQGLRDLGYVEGQNIRFEFRSAEGHLDRLPELAAELVRLKVDIIVTCSRPPLWRQGKRRMKSRSSWPRQEIPSVRDWSRAFLGPAETSPAWLP